MTIKDVASLIAFEINSKSKKVTASVNSDGKVILYPKKSGIDHGLLSAEMHSDDVLVGDAVAFSGGESKRALELIGNEGDTFFQRWDSIKSYPRSADDVNQVFNGMSVMLESHINLDARNDIDRGTTKLADVQFENFGKINPVYTQRNNLVPSSTREVQDNLDEYRSSVTWTGQKNDGADIDEWTHITLSSSLKLDGDKGKVNALRRFNNSIISFQEKGIAEILFNSRTQITSTEGVPIEIANSNKVDGKRYITNKYGTSNKWSIVEGKTGLFFIDSLNKIIGVFNGNGIESISTKSQLDAWVRENNSVSEWNPATDDNYIAFYDKIHSDVYFINSNNKEQPCLVYNEILGGFVGFYDYSEIPMMTNLSDRFLSFRNNRLWLQNEGQYCNFFGENKPFWITWRVAPDNFSDKLWTNIEYRADFLKVLSEDAGIKSKYYDSRKKIYDYLYEIRYSNLDYDFAYKYFKYRNVQEQLPGCTSIKKGNLYGKSLDWKYSYQVDFITYSKDVVGICGVLPELTRSVVEDEGRIDDELFRILPFRLLDGVNYRYGIYATVNVVSACEEYGTTTATIPLKEIRTEICSSMVVRYVLDHFRTAKDAVEYLRDYTSIYMPQELISSGFECHYMIADKHNSYIVEFINNRVEIIENPIMTNFYLFGTTANTDGTYYTPESLPEHSARENGIVSNSQGLERYNLCVNEYGAIKSVSSMRSLLDSIRFTHAYTDSDWYTEFVSETLTVDSPVSDFEPVISNIKTLYSSQTDESLRSGELFWHTTHASIYDLDTMSLSIRTQESEIYNVSLLEHFDSTEQNFIDGDTDTKLTATTFDELSVWNEYQTTGVVPISTRRGIIRDNYPDVTMKFRVWRLDIPRAIKNVTSGNKFGLDRIRNPWVFVKLKKNSGNFGQELMQLHDVIVKYFRNI